MTTVATDTSVIVVPCRRGASLLAVVIMVVLLIPATAGAQAQQAARASTCTKSDTLSKGLDFADLHRAQRILGHKDRWARQLSDFDMGASQRTAEPTNLKEFLDFAAGAGRRWTATEEANWKALVDKLSDAMRGLNLHLPNIYLVKTSGEEEFDAAYTRRNVIMLPESMTSRRQLIPAGPIFCWRTKHFTFCREWTLSCGMTSMRFLDSRPCMDQYPAELEERRISNPDAFITPHIDRSIRVRERQRHTGDSIVAAVERGHSAPEFLRGAGHRSCVG